MTQTEFINLITRRVMERLACAAPNGTATPTGSAATLDAPVVTEELLEQKLGSTSSVVFNAKTVLTPSARDYLRRNNISWSRGSAAATNSTLQSSAVAALLCGPHGQLEQALSAAGWPVRRVSRPAECSKLAIQTIKAGQSKTLLVASPTPAAVACLTNRDCAVRAAVVAKASDIRSSAGEIGANVICVNPSNWTAGDFQNVVQALRHYQPEPPAGWSV